MGAVCDAASPLVCVQDRDEQELEHLQPARGEAALHLPHPQPVPAAGRGAGRRQGRGRGSQVRPRPAAGPPQEQHSSNLGTQGQRYISNI